MAFYAGRITLCDWLRNGAGRRQYQPFAIQKDHALHGVPYVAWM